MKKQQLLSGLQGVYTRIKKKVNPTHLLLAFVITIVFFGLFARLSYALDTYCVILNDEPSMLRHLISCGRLLTWAFIGIFYALDLSLVTFYRISFIIAIIALTLAIYLLQDLLRKLTKAKPWLCLLLATAILINPFTFELFFYIEKGVMVGSLLFCVIAVRYLYNYIQSRRKGAHVIVNKNLWLSLAFTTLAAFSYQGTIGIFIVLATLVVILNIKKTSDFIKYTATSIVLYGLPCLLNLAFIRIFSTNSRASGDIDFAQSLQSITSQSPALFRFFDILPIWLLPSLLLIVILSIIFYTVCAHRDWKRLGKCLISIAYIMVVVILATLAPSLIQDSDSIQFMPRTTYVFATLLGVFLAVVVYYYHKVVSYTSGLVAIWLACTCYQTYGITQSLYIVNFMDARRAESIANEVDQIKSKGLDPNQLVFVKLNNTMSTYPGVFTVRDLNITSYYVAWASAQTYCTFANCNRLTTNNETRDISFEDAVKDIQDNTLIRKASSGDVLYVQDNTVYVLTR